MHTLVDFCLIPLSSSLSLSPYIAKCQKILANYPLTCTLHAYGTTIEGDWDSIFLAIKECHKLLHQDGVPRIHTQLKIGTRIDKTQSAADKVRSVHDKMEDSHVD
ncbi:MAG: MTH1187 family thiamine-binding protein [bacterium]